MGFDRAGSRGKFCGYPMRAFSRLLPGALFLAVLAAGTRAGAQTPLVLRAGEDGAPVGVTRARPLDTLLVDVPAGDSLEVRDGVDHVYFTGDGGRVAFMAAGALGRQAVVLPPHHAARIARTERTGHGPCVSSSGLFGRPGGW